MDNSNNNFQPEEEKPEIPAEDILQEVATIPIKPKNRNTAIILSAVVLVALIAGSVWFLTKDKSDTTSDKLASDTVATVEESTVEEEVVAEETAETTVCPDGQTQFADVDFGAKFCYPSEWGTASVMDAKVAVADTGYREAVRFSINTKFIVGGTSDSWSTTVGRGVGCQEPNNNVPDLSTYDTAWHDYIGSGMDVEFALRSLESTEGGYDMTETASNLIDNGVCVQGHKVIDGSRYRVFFAAYYTDFNGGVLSPRAHIDNPNTLFSLEERSQFDALLASASAY